MIYCASRRRPTAEESTASTHVTVNSAEPGLWRQFSGRTVPRKNPRDRRLDFLNAPCRSRMGAEEFRRGWTIVGLFLKDLHDAQQRSRIVVGVDRELHTEPVRLQLITASVFEIDNLSDQTCHRRGVVFRIGDDRGGRQSPCELSAGQLLGAVSGDNVANFMGQHARDLTACTEPMQQRGRDEDLAPRQRKRIHLTRVGQHVKLKLIFRLSSGTAFNQSTADLVNKILCFIVFQ